LNGMTFRVWEGVSAKGVNFIAIVNRLESADPEVQAALIQEVITAQKEPAGTTQSALERLGVVPASAAPPTSTAV
jgi:hypothetical protein